MGKTVQLITVEDWKIKEINRFLEVQYPTRKKDKVGKRRRPQSI